MAKVKTLILRTAGTNCDRELAHGFELAGSETDFVHINALAENPAMLAKYKIIGLPGGFTYGDDIGAGKVMANEINNRLAGLFPEFVRRGGLIIGICNGFQALIKTGLLPDINEANHDARATLTFNDSRKFEARWVYLKPEKSPCVFWNNDDEGLLYVPAAHGEGKFVTQSQDVLEKIKKQNQVVFRYTDAAGVPAGYPWNPNGSPEDIAGICDPTGHILGMMPHPERHLYAHNHPRWTRSKNNTTEGAGLRLFKNAIKYFKD